MEKSINNKLHTYGSKLLAFDVGEKTKDNYTIDIVYYHNVDSDEITYKCQVIKNWTYSEKPENAIEGKKYREILFNGSVKECDEFVTKIVNEEGKWKQNPEKPFEKIFIPGTK